MAGAFDRLRRWWEGAGGEVEAHAPSAAPREGPTIAFADAHAVIVGVGGDLPNTVDDAKALRDILVDTGRCGYPENNVRLLTGPEATQTNILQALDALALKTTESSTVLIYFSGHGMRSGSAFDARYYLMASGYNLADLAHTAVEGEEFRKRVAAIASKKLLLVLDCCHAGGIELAKAPNLVKAPLPAPAEMLAAGGGRVLIASSTADEVSFAGKPYSVFTMALIEALSGRGAAKKDGFVRASDLALYTHAAVKQRTKDRQHPLLDMTQADNFAVSYYAGGALAPKEPPLGPAPQVDLGGGELVPMPPVVIKVFDQPGWTVGTAVNTTGPVTLNVDNGPPKVRSGDGSGS